MLTSPTRIRPFLGSKDFGQSRAFYRELGFTEHAISEDMCVFNAGAAWFYLQDYYVKDWVDNSMVFLEVDDLQAQHAAVVESEIIEHFPGSKVSSIQANDWGSEFFLHDPAGNLWHIGTFAD